MFISLFLIFLFVLLTNQASSTGSNKRKGYHGTGESSSHKCHRLSYKNINSQFQYGITINTFDIGDFVQVWNSCKINGHLTKPQWIKSHWSESQWIDGHWAERQWIATHWACQWLKARIVNVNSGQYEVVILEYEGEHKKLYGKIFTRKPEVIRNLDPNEPTGWNAFKIGDFVKISNLVDIGFEWLEAIITDKKVNDNGAEEYFAMIIEDKYFGQIFNRTPNFIMMSNNLQTFEVGSVAYIKKYDDNIKLADCMVEILGINEEMFKYNVRKIHNDEMLELYPYELQK